MQQFHHKTDITLKNSFEQTQFIDWRTQPRSFKLYPKFFRRFFIDDYEELKFIKNFGKITTIKQYGKEEVKLRANPSAGGLYPCEIYIQIRGVKKVLSGIYHYEPLNDSLCLIHELSNDGLEYYFENLTSQKFIILVSNVYFRSSWKYENRALRYLLLDTGHQLASIFASLKLENIEFSFSFDFDKKSLNEDFGFQIQEFFQGAILVNNEKESKPKKLREEIISVSPTDYFRKNLFIEEFIKRIEQEKFTLLEEFTYLLENFSKEELQISINNRRSVRAFKNEALKKEDFEYILKDIFPASQKLELEIFFVNNNVENLEKGVYKNVTLLRNGDFSELSTHLAFNQKLAGSSGFTLFFTAKEDSNYLKTTIFSSFLAHIINLRASFLNIGCSGIGAYFDDECQKFLDTKNPILYLQAIGQ